MNCQLRAIVYDEEIQAKEKRKGLLKILQVEIDANDKTEPFVPVHDAKIMGCTPLILLPSAKWTCLNSQDTCTSIALNREKTIFSVGMYDGCIQIWDNMSFRVVTRVLHSPLSTLVSEQDSQDRYDTSSTSVILPSTDTVLKVDTRAEPNLPTLSVSFCAWSCNSQYLYAGYHDVTSHLNHLVCWDVPTMSPSRINLCSTSGVITYISCHPAKYNGVLISQHNNCPVYVNATSGEQSQLPHSLHVGTEIGAEGYSNRGVPSSWNNARFGNKGVYAYVASSKNFVAMYKCIEGKWKLIAELVPSVDILYATVCPNAQENAIIVSTVKGILEISITHENSGISLSETRLYTCGAVRSPWMTCCFGGVKEDVIVGLPVLRQRHAIGQESVYAWYRADGSVFHGIGVKEGLLSLTYVADNTKSATRTLNQDAMYAISLTNCLYVFEHEFKSKWPGAMYPPGFRVISDNERYVPIDTTIVEKQSESKKRVECFDSDTQLPHVLPSIPTCNSKFMCPPTSSVLPDGLRQSVFEPFHLVSVSDPKKKRKSDTNEALQRKSR